MFISSSLVKNKGTGAKKHACVPWLCSNIQMCLPAEFIIGVQVHLLNVEVKVECQGHMVKIEIIQV